MLPNYCAPLDPCVKNVAVTCIKPKLIKMVDVLSICSDPFCFLTPFTIEASNLLIVFFIRILAEVSTDTVYSS